MTIPHWAPPTHAMQIFRYAEQGSIGFLWISATNPAVSMPELGPDPRHPGQASAFRGRPGPVPDRDRGSSPTSCCRPRGGARRPGRFTNVNRTVHLSDKAVDPPGEARSDLDIFLDYARRMGFTDP